MADGTDDMSRYEVDFVQAFSQNYYCSLVVIFVLYFVLFQHVFLAYFLSVGCPLYFPILVLAFIKKT